VVSAIDRQQSILQSNVTERIQQVQQQHPDLQQRYFEIQLAQERRKMLKKINESEEMDHAKLRDEERKQQEDRQRKNETATSDMHEETSGEQEQRSHIDIKV
jgi:hypothetical protein